MSLKVLVLNSGSSSIKFELFEMPSEKRQARGLLEKIGEEQSKLTYTIGDSKYTIDQKVADHGQGLRLIIDALTDQSKGGLKDISEIGAVGHRVVHGGEAFSETVIIDDKVQKAVEEHIQLAPLHNPPNLLGIKVARELLPNVPQVAVFDTAYHQTMPAYAFTYPIPYELYEQLRVRRYGFHGTSHRYVAARAAKILGRKLEETNLITAHLGNGASMTAIQNGKSIDTTMGLTPLEGLIMGTRCGDIDPAIIAFLARVKDMPVAQIDNLLNKKSGMLGVSGLSNDMRSVEQAANEGNTRAALALEMYCYRIKKYVGAYTAAIGNVHALVFTAGVGENSDVVRERVCSNLQNIGYKIDVEKNRGVRGKELDIATADSPIRILIIPTNEELMIAQDTYALTAKK
ncbi:MAG TPA: acetate kinase [Polyangiaceae bacterium]|jgi:acetate kinase|nr:MAG: Acetate kinase [Deltaproteobacteria bacterium ADurb.Bin207]HNS96742.1 acetate kinase [Polyangiaceae bacterium]HNZ20673.1 acetate kinase [Polyangiaceae bacterium]HOD20711.1 acetate kinase [Polyangiaceae bacterium]HOE47131.1 acetate kinase [Polyangiaceae bacterium]